jgi:L-ascorbate metabolism protein UlaG (beta-lactamase superfamily)
VRVIPALPLGQAGFRLEFPAAVVYIDPYLSDAVEECEGALYRRQTPAPFEARSVRDADWVLISHGHLDHCDPAALPEIARASPDCLFLGPNEIRSVLGDLGVPEHRIVEPKECWLPLAEGLQLRPVPAAHPCVERDDEGQLRCLGFVLEHDGRRIYHAGDTSVHEQLIRELAALAPIHTALLPVNERNFFRDRLGITGNMSVREAFQLAEEIGVETLVPIHWDMFALNSVFPEEIFLLYEKLQPPFSLQLNPMEL